MTSQDHRGRIVHELACRVLHIESVPTTGSQEFLKLLPKGAFMLPVARDGEKFVAIDRKKLGTLFRS